MKKMAKVAALLAAMALAAGMTACQKKDGADGRGAAQKSAGTAKPTPVNEFRRELTEDGSGVKILEYTGSAKSVVIPSEIEGLPVKEIGKSAFKGDETMKSITIPDSVEEIVYRAFRGCTALESVTLGNSVQEIGDEAFYDCWALKSITIPDSVKKIGGSAFYDCWALKSVTLGNSVQEIDEFAFSYCKALESLTIPDSLQKIKFTGKYGAFSNTVLPLATQTRLKALGYTGDF